MSCDSGDDGYWGCGKDSNRLSVQVYYHASHEARVGDRSIAPSDPVTADCPSGVNLVHGWYNMSGYNVLSDELIIDLFIPRHVMLSWGGFSLAYYETLCGINTDNVTGTVCADVYFYYDEC